MRQFQSFVRKEFIHIFRDPRTLLILLLMPQIMVLLPGYVVKNEVKDIRVTVVDPSNDAFATHIIGHIATNKYFIMKERMANEAEAIGLFLKDETDLVVVFSPDFATHIGHSRDACIRIISDGSEPNHASVRAAYAQQIIMDALKELLQTRTPSAHVSTKGGIQAMNIHVDNRLLFNPQQRSEVNFVPGVVALTMMLICCMMTSVSIVRERERGTMEVLLASPLPVIYIVLAKLLPYMAISLANIAMMLFFTNCVMDIPMTGNMATYILAAVIYIFTALMLGLLISTCAGTQLAAMLISLLLIVPSLYLSGMIFPVDGMPVAAQTMSNIVPAKWFVSASRKIMAEGVELKYVIREMSALLTEGLIFLLLSWKLFKTRLE